MFFQLDTQLSSNHMHHPFMHALYLPMSLIILLVPLLSSPGSRTDDDLRSRAQDINSLNSIIIQLQSSDNTDIDWLLHRVRLILTADRGLRVAIAHSPRTSADLFFPLISKYKHKHQNLTHFPNLSLDGPLHSLSAHFYQTLSTVALNPDFMGKLLAIKLIDECTRNALYDISWKNLISFAGEPSQVIVSRSLSFHDTVYDPTFYGSDTEYWSILKRLHIGPAPLASIASLAYSLRKSVEHKIQFAKNPKTIEV